MTAQEGPSPGRPRSAEADRAILRATFAALLEHGLAGVSMEGVAGAAGVAKTTVYRRYDSREDLIADAIAEALAVDTPPEVDDTREALRNILFPSPRTSLGSWPARARLIADIFAREGDHPRFAALMRERVAAPRLANARRILERAVARGEVRPGVDTDAVATAIFGGMLAYEMTGLGASEDSLDALIDVVWSGIAT